MAEKSHAAGASLGRIGEAESKKNGRKCDSRAVYLLLVANSGEVFESFDALQVWRDIFELVALLIVPDNLIVMMQRAGAFIAVEHAIFAG
jgi:hypothetical protein